MLTPAPDAEGWEPSLPLAAPAATTTITAEDEDPSLDAEALAFIKDEVVPCLSDARAMLEEHQKRTGPFRVARDSCQSTAADLDAVAAALRTCDATTPLGVVSAAARRGVTALAGWTEEPGFASSMAQFGDPSCMASEFRALAQDVHRQLRGGNPAVSAVREAGEAAGLLSAAEAAERMRENMRAAAAACNARNGGVHALPALELSTVADALETLVRGGGSAAAAAHALAGALVPTFFAPLLGAPGNVPEAVTAAADDVAQSWREGDGVVKASGAAVDGLGGCGLGAKVCSAAIIEHIPSSSNMAPRVAEAASEFLSVEVARGQASPPSPRSLVEALRAALIEHVRRHVEQVVAAVRTFGVRRDESSRRNNDGKFEEEGESGEEGEVMAEEEEEAEEDSAAFAEVLGAVERDSPFLALSAVDAVADQIQERFATMSALAADVAAKKLRGLINPILSSTNHGWRFRQVAFRGAGTKMALLADDVKRATSASVLLHRLSRMGRPPTPTPSPESSLELPMLMAPNGPPPEEEREEVTQGPPLPPTKKKRSNLMKTRAERIAGAAPLGGGGGVSMLTLAADELEHGEGSRDWSSFVIDGVEGESNESDRAPVSSKLGTGRSSDEADATAMQLGEGDTAPRHPQRAPDGGPNAATDAGAHKTTHENAKGAARAVTSSESLRKAMRKAAASHARSGGGGGGVGTSSRGGARLTAAAARHAGEVAAAEAVEALAAGRYHGHSQGADTYSSAGGAVAAWGTGDSTWPALGLASQITGAKRPRFPGGDAAWGTAKREKKAKPSTSAPKAPSSPGGGLGSLAAAAISEDEDRRMSALHKSQAKAKAKASKAKAKAKAAKATKAVEVGKAAKSASRGGGGGEDRINIGDATAATVVAVASPSVSDGDTPIAELLATPSQSLDDDECRDPMVALLKVRELESRLRRLHQPTHQQSASAPTPSDNSYVAVALGKLCAAMSVELPAGTIDTFASDLARCPQGIRNLLTPLAQGSSKVTHLLQELPNLVKPFDKSPFQMRPPPAAILSWKGSPPPADADAAAAAHRSLEFGGEHVRAGLTKDATGAGVLTGATSADAGVAAGAGGEGVAADCRVAGDAAVAGLAGIAAAAAASAGTADVGDGGDAEGTVVARPSAGDSSGGGAGFTFPTMSMRRTAGAASAAAALTVRRASNVEMTEEKRASLHPPSPDVFAFDGAEA